MLLENIKNLIKGIDKYILFAVSIFLCAFDFCNINAQTFSSSLLESNTIIQTDRRPIPVGFYDSTVNKTFVSWIGANSHPVVKAFDHTTQTWSPNVIAGSSPFNDKHNYPGMLKGADGRIYIFYGCHNSTMKMTVSQDPLSIDGTWNDKFITEAQDASYPAPIITVDGTFYVFYRDTRRQDGKSQDRPYQYVKSTDNGATWTRHMAIDPYPRTTDGTTEVYNGKVTYEPPHGDQNAKIHIAWTLAGPKLPTQSEHATLGQNVYYAYLDPGNDHFYNVVGMDMGFDIDTSEDDSLCLVLNTGLPESSHSAGLQVSVNYRDNGLPIIHFDNRNAGGQGTATWDGSQWVFAQIGAGGGDPREIEKFGPESFRTYHPSGSSVNVYKTLNGGLDWTFETSFQIDESMSRCYVINNFNPDVKLLLTQRPGSITTTGSVYTASVTSNFSPEYIPGDGTTVPTTPGDLELEVSPEKDTLSFSWADSEGETSCMLEYSSDDKATWNGFHTIGRDVTGYVADATTGFEPATTYHFRIRGENSYVYSGYSNEVSFTTDSISTPGGTGALPPSWNSEDIGITTPEGSAGMDSTGTFVIEGAGSDVWGSSDHFHYVYQRLSGDGVITARVDSIEHTNDWAKTGVMIRETLEGNSPHAMSIVTPLQLQGNGEKGVSLQYRTSKGGSTSISSGSEATAPHWVRLSRRGGTFTGYDSFDGVNWNLIETVTIPMVTNIYVGLMLTSHNSGILGTSQISNVSVTNDTASGAYIWLEAESGNITSPMKKKEDYTASAGYYVVTDTGKSTSSAPEDGRTTYNFEVTEEGNYKIWGRVKAATGDDDSFWIKVDENEWISWNEIERGEEWIWDEVHDSNNGKAVVTYNLTPGVHTLTITYREDGTLLDKFVITGDESYSPNSETTPVSIEDKEEFILNDNYVLNNSYPNPFNPETNISYVLPKAGNVKLTIYDITGREIATLVDNYQPAGNHKLTWNAKDSNGRQLASGVYFARMEAGNFVKTIKLMLLK